MYCAYEYLQMLMLVTEPSQEVNNELEWMIKLLRLSVLQIIYVCMCFIFFGFLSPEMWFLQWKWKMKEMHMHTYTYIYKIHVANTLAFFHTQVVSCNNNLRFYCYWMLLTHLFPMTVQGLYIILLIILFLQCKPLSWVDWDWQAQN